MRIQSIPKLINENTVWIIGTGPSLRCLPMSFFGDKVSIGLNQSWRHLKTTYSITVHPELVIEYDAYKGKKPDIQWVIKKKPPLAHLELDDKRHYVFGTSYDVDCVVKRPKDTLYLGEGVQTTAMDLAARIGARYVVLVGCDAKSLDGDFHGHDQHVRWLGIQPEQQYELYRRRTAETREALRSIGVGVMTLSPFIGTDAAEEDYARLKKVLNLERLPEPKDTSAYTRDMPKE